MPNRLVSLVPPEQPLPNVKPHELGEDAYDLRGSCGFTFGNGCSGGTSETNLFGAPKSAAKETARRAKTPMEVA